MGSSNHFPSDYAAAREAFLRVAESRGASLSSHPLRERGPRGEELCVDVAYLGSEAPRRVLAVSSGVHGAEGYCGSALQHRLLTEQLDGLALPPDAGCLLVHAVNPFGFAHTRRVNESNVDLNRNFLRHPEEHVPNPDYDSLCAHLNPESLDAESEAVHERALFAFAEEHGFRRLQEVVTRGQYEYPHGVQFGGVREEASNRILREVARNQTRGARAVAWVDVHTGLGEYGAVEMITELPPEAPAYRRGKAWYGDRARSTQAGESLSPATEGSMDRGILEAIGPEAEVTVYGAEFGTYDPVRVFRAMRSDNWLHRYGDPDSEQGRIIKGEMLEVFRPADPAWQSRVLERGAEILALTWDGLLAS